MNAQDLLRAAGTSIIGVSERPKRAQVASEARWSSYVERTRALAARWSSHCEHPVAAEAAETVISSDYTVIMVVFERQQVTKPSSSESASESLEL